MAIGTQTFWRLFTFTTIALVTGPLAARAPSDELDERTTVPASLRHGLEIELQEHVRKSANKMRKEENPTIRIETIYAIPVQLKFADDGLTVVVDLGKEVGQVSGEGSIEYIEQTIFNGIEWRLREYKLQTVKFLYGGRDYYDIHPSSEVAPRSGGSSWGIRPHTR